MNHKPFLILALLALPAWASAKESLVWGGRIMLDNTAFDGVHNSQEQGSEWEVRRLRLGVTHRTKDNWRLKVELSFNPDEKSVGLADGYIQYRGWESSRFTFGYMKENFGLENTTSSLDISALERSIVTDTFSPGRNYGSEISNGSNKHTLSLGLFQASEDAQGADGYALTGRFTLSPINRDGRLLHLGASGSIRDMRGTTYRINDPLEVNTADTVIESRRITTDQLTLTSLEAAAVVNQWSIQGEWMSSQIKETEAAESDVAFSGYYFLLSYCLTGESRGYKGGSFGGIEPSGTGGAWELIARYSTIDLVDTNLGTWAESTTVGLNYYASAHLRFMLNIGWVDVRSSKVNDTGTGRSAGFRAQYAF